MWKKLFNKCSVSAFFALIWGIGWGIATFLFEGWGMNEIQTLFSHPAGWASIILIIFSICLFIWNIFIRDELTPYEHRVKTDARQPDLSKLKNDLANYFKKTHLLTRNEKLYEPSLYGLEQDISLKLLIPFTKMLIDNTEFQKLKVNTNEISGLRESIEATIERLDNKRLKKLIYKAIEREHPARSQQILIRLFRLNYQQTERSENKLLVAEAHTKEPNKVRIFGKCLRELYKHIRIMERGEDL